MIAFASQAWAQSDDTSMSEFEAFKQKLQNAQIQAKQNEAASNTQKATASPATPSYSADASVSPLSSMSASSKNPLGVAAQLPLRQNSANAIQSPVQQMMTNEQKMQARDAYLKKQEDYNKRKAFEAGLEQLMPLEPQYIRELLEEFRKNREASETPITVPTPKTEVKTVSLDPSDPPLDILTSPGYVTTLNVLDSTGSPWAIQDVSWAGDFDITGGEFGSHILRIIPKSAHGVGNISIRLVDLTTPITLSLKTGLNEVHYRFDARIPKQGPLAKTPIIDNSGMGATSSVGDDSKMVKFLEGTPPSQAEALTLNGVDDRTKAWRAGDNIYLRTPLTLLSPSWDSSVSSADGMNVYTLGDAPVLLLSDQGRMVKAYIVNELGELE